MATKPKTDKQAIPLLSKARHAGGPREREEVFAKLCGYGSLPPSVKEPLQLTQRSQSSNSKTGEGLSARLPEDPQTPAGTKGCSQEPVPVRVAAIETGGKVPSRTGREPARCWGMYLGGHFGELFLKN